MDDDDRDADVQDDDDVEDARKQVCKSLDQVVDGGVGAGGAKTNLGATRLKRQILYLKKNWLERLIFNICLLSR